MRRGTSTIMRGLLLALVALLATGESWHAHASVVRETVGAALPSNAYTSAGVAVKGVGAADAAAGVEDDDTPADHVTQDLISRRIERPLPFLAGQGALESLLEINPRVNVRSSERINGSDETGSDARPARLSQLRVRLATWQHAAFARLLARASQGALHQFSTAPPAPISLT